MSVEKILDHPDYCYEKVHQASAAATGLYKWVKASRDYFYIFQEIQPRRDAFILSQK
jgi:dynein heavy chain